MMNRQTFSRLIVSFLLFILLGASSNAQRVALIKKRYYRAGYYHAVRAQRLQRARRHSYNVGYRHAVRQSNHLRRVAHRTRYRGHIVRQHVQNENYRRSVGMSDPGHYTRQRMENVGYRAGRGLNRVGHGLHHFGHRLWQGITGR